MIESAYSRSSILHLRNILLEPEIACHCYMAARASRFMVYPSIPLPPSRATPDQKGSVPTDYGIMHFTDGGQFGLYITLA